MYWQRRGGVVSSRTSQYPLCQGSSQQRGAAMMTTDSADRDSEWQRKGATLSDKTAREEFGLTQDEIVQGIRTGKLHYRKGSMHGNPWMRLLRREVEALVKTRHGDDFLKDQQAKAELAGINRELRRLKAQVASLEQRRSQLTAKLAK
jgi:hypothetical protein